MIAANGDDPDPVGVTRATYERVAASYEARNATVPGVMVAARAEWAASLRPGTRVLDAGAGPGWHAVAFAAAGFRTVALDLAAAMSGLARGRGVPAVLGDVRRLPFADGAFGGVWSSASLLHVPRPDAPATLAEWRRVTAGGGGLALMTATGKPDGWEDSPYEAGDAEPLRRWFTHHDADGLAGMAEAGGWRVTSLTSERGELRHWLHLRAVAR